MPSEKASYTLGKSDDRAFKLNPIITHRSRNGGAGGGPGPPNVGAVKVFLSVKMDFLIHIPAIFARLKPKF